MTPGAGPPPPAATPVPVLRGLDAVTAARPAAEVLAAVPWDGPALDPETTAAGDFLARL